MAAKNYRVQAQSLQGCKGCCALRRDVELLGKIEFDNLMRIHIYVCTRCIRSHVKIPRDVDVSIFEVHTSH